MKIAPCSRGHTLELRLRDGFNPVRDHFFAGGEEWRGERLIEVEGAGEILAIVRILFSKNLLFDQ